MACSRRNNTNKLMVEIPPKLSNITTIVERNTNNVIIKGYLGNLFVMITVNGICVSGSLSKYYHGNNMYTLTFAEINLAFKMLEKQLNIPIEKAKVQRLDIAENFIVNYPIRNYFPYLGDMTYYERQELNDGVYYNGGNKTLLFYDKVSERKFNKESVPECYVGKNILRYELRFMKRLGKLFDRKCIYVSDLLLEPFFTELLYRYKMYYQNIHKNKDIIHYGDLQINDWRQFNNQVDLAGMEKLGGESALLNTLIQAKKDKAFKNPMHATRVIKRIKTTYENNIFTEQSSLVRELDDKIQKKLDVYLFDQLPPHNAKMV